MANRDYYDILGVTRQASQDQIKSSYRKLAIKYHPDKNRGDAKAEDSFKEATEAYEVLSDTQKRSRYDQFGKAGVNASGSSSYGTKAYSDFSDIFGDVGDVFSDFFGGGFGGGQSARSRGADLRYNLDISLEDSALGKEVKVQIPREETCDACKGKGSAPNSGSTDCSTCNGIGQVRRTQGFFSVTTTCPSCNGKGQVIRNPCNKCSGNGVIERSRNLNIKIPPGMDTGSRLKIKGEGESSRSGLAGDLYVVVNILNHHLFERQGNDLIMQVDVPLRFGLLGGEVEVPTIDGSRVKMKIPVGTESGRIFRIKSKGLPSIEGRKKGDQHVLVNLKIPQSMTKRATQLAKELDDELLNNGASGREYAKIEVNALRQ